MTVFSRVTRPGLPAAAIAIAAVCSDPINGELGLVGSGDVVWSVPHEGRGRVIATSDLVFFPGEKHDVIAVKKSTGAVVWRSVTPIQSEETIGFGLAVAGDVVVFADFNLYAFDRRSGALRWEFTGGGAGPAQAVPVGNRAHVYSGSVSGVVFALRASDGSELWQAPAPFDGAYLAMDPVLTGDTLFVGYAERFPGRRGGLAALDALTGSLLWASDFSPLINAAQYSRCLGNAVVDSTNVYAWLEHGDVVALDRATGAVRWFRPQDGIAEGNWRQLALVGKTLVVASFDGHFEGVDAPTGDLLWTRRPGLGSVLQPTISDGAQVYAISAAGSLAAIDPATGDSRWILGGTPTRRYNLYGTPAIDDENIYIGGGNLWAVKK